MQVDDEIHDHAEEALISRAVRGTLTPAETIRLESHVAGCTACAALLEAARILSASVAPGPDDDALDDAAVARAMARLGQPGARPDARADLAADEALDLAAVEGAMARLDVRARPIAKPRNRRWPAVAVLGAAAAAGIAFAVFQAPEPAGRIATTPPATVGHPVVLADGSEVAPDDAATTIQIGEQTATRTIVRLPSGAARFRVRHDSRRLFRVDAGAVQIDDLGTVFRVAHEAGGHVRVVVAEGRVAVVSSASGARVELAAGEERMFPATAEPARAIAGPSDAPAPPTQPPPPVASAPRGQPRVRVADDPADLLAAADVARRSHDPKAAVAPLRRLVEHYPKDPRAPSAAFTLGWVLLTDLNRPREAAAAFAVAERIAPRGALAEDAAARVAEAWQNAGESRRAAEAARHYEQMYPTGRYIALMRGLIGKH